MHSTLEETWQIPGCTLSHKTWVEHSPTPALAPVHAEVMPRLAPPAATVRFDDLHRLCVEINTLSAHETEAGMAHLLMRLGTLLHAQRVECSLVNQNNTGKLVTQLWHTWTAPGQHMPVNVVQTLLHNFPLGEHAYFAFALKRTAAIPEFEAQTRDWLACAVAGLGRWLQWLALSHGVPSPHGPMTPQQRKVLLCLLSGLNEKQIANKLKLNIHTTHQCITAIYRRFDVRSRASLTAQWLGGMVKA